MKQEYKNQVKNNIICSHCGYKWKTKSKLITVTCPSCKYTTKNNQVF